MSIHCHIRTPNPPAEDHGKKAGSPRAVLWAALRGQPPFDFHPLAAIGKAFRRPPPRS